MSNQDIPQIYYTHDYEKFMIFEENRKVSQHHVEKLAQDETFAENFPSCPIVVTTDYRIIDGQHRFEAAKRLDAGIYYIISKNGTVHNIIKRNVNQKAWEQRDYLDFFSKTGNLDYQKFDYILKDTGITISQGLVILAKFSNKHGKTLTYNFKSGVLLVLPFCENMLEFSRIYSHFIRQCESIKGKSATAPLRMNAYASAFAEYFITQPGRMNRLLSQMLKMSPEFPFCSREAQAERVLFRCYNWRKPKFSEFDSDMAQDDIAINENAREAINA